MTPDDLIAYVKDSGLRGRGGAGFPTGMKWQFIPARRRQAALSGRQRRRVGARDLQGHPADVGQPALPHRGRLSSPAYAIRSRHAFIYCAARSSPCCGGCTQAVEEAYAAGYLGKNILGSGLRPRIVVHAGAGAYICGEETALLDSLEGRRGQPRLRPPFPAVAGLYACPTVVNNVESIASVPAILHRGKEWFKSMGSEKSPGFTLYSLSGHVASPGQYEAPLGITLRQLLDMTRRDAQGPPAQVLDAGRLFDADVHRRAPRRAAGLRGRGRGRLDARHQGAAVLRRDHLRGAGGARWTEFYAHESCGKCTPCREGRTGWCSCSRDSRPARARGRPRQAARHRRQHQRQVVLRARRRRGRPIVSSLKYFRDEYEQHITGKRLPVRPAPASTRLGGRQHGGDTHDCDDE